MNSGASLRVVESVIANISKGTAIIVDETGDDFATELELVTFAAASNRIPALSSGGLVLAQSCEGLEAADAADANVGTCATTERYCMTEVRTWKHNDSEHARDRT